MKVLLKLLLVFYLAKFVHIVLIHTTIVIQKAALAILLVALMVMVVLPGLPVNTVMNNLSFIFLAALTLMVPMAFCRIILVFLFVRLTRRVVL